MSRFPTVGALILLSQFDLLAHGLHTPYYGGVVLMAMLPPSAAVFKPKWGTVSTEESAGRDARGRDRQSGQGGQVTGQAHAGAGVGGRKAAGGSRAGGGTCGAAYPADTPVAPTFRQKLHIPATPPPPDRSSEVDPKSCTLHAPPGTSFRHGVTVGFTVMARNSKGEAVPARGLPFVFNVTNVGDSSSGTVFDLQNGTYYVYSTVYFSPDLLKKPGPQVWVRLQGQHIQGSPFEVPLNMGAISDDFERRLALADAAGHDANLGGEQGCGGDFVIVTGASSGFFDRAVNLVGSIHHWAPRVKVIFYDLGLSRVQAEDVATWEDVEMRKFVFDQYGDHLHVDEKKTRNGVQGAYSWRAPILLNVSDEHQCMLWLDAGIEVRAPLTTIIGHIAVDGHFFVTNGWPSPNKFTHPAVSAWFGLDQDTHFYVPDPEGGRRNEVEACGGIQGYRRDGLMRAEILTRYHRCLMEPGCAAPPDASKMNYRQDQTVLNVALADYRKGVALDSREYFLSLPHTARKYWEHPVPKHQFPVREDGTFQPCDKGQVFREGECVACDEPDGLCEDDVLDEMPGATYVDDLVLFIRRSFEPKLYEEALRYSLLGSI
jgi:hypothetical protein